MRFSIMRLALWTTAIAVIAVLFLPARSRADEFNLKTYITVNQPVQVPGAVLQPDVKYVFRRVGAESGTNHLVRVLNADETKVLTTFFAISDERLEPAEGTILTFYETAPGYAKPVRSWFYPGREIGLEFLYPKKQMAEITAHLRGTESATVQTAAVQMPAEPQPSTETSEPAVENSAIAQNTEPEIQRETPVETPPQTVSPTVPESENTTQTSEADQGMAQLPRTAGELPLLGLFGLIGLGAFGVRRALSRQ